MAQGDSKRHGETQHGEMTKDMVWGDNETQCREMARDMVRDGTGRQQER